MSNVARFGPRQRRPAAGKRPFRTISRDLFAVLVVLGVGLSIVWPGMDVPEVRAFFGAASVKLQDLAADLSALTLGKEDNFPVSSIGDKTRARPGDPRRYPVCSGQMARDNCVVDGDTFHMDGITVRISDIDAPETHPPRCAYEADLGDRATRRLSQLLSGGAFQLVRADRDLDKYGRQLRVVIRDGRSIGKMLVVEGLARTWTGKRRPWCPSGPSS